MKIKQVHGELKSSAPAKNDSSDTKCGNLRMQMVAWELSHDF